MKKVLSLFIVSALIFGLLPLTAFAADTDIAGTGTPINRVDVTGVIPPVPGNKPAYDISIPEDANYTVESVFWYTTDQAYIPPDTVFEAGKDYMIGVEVAPKDGYEFPDTVTGTINGQEAAVEELEKDKSILVEYTFTCQEEQSVPGDADGDGETTALDVTCIQRYNAHISTGLERKIEKNGDIDGNGLSEIIDATYIQRYLARMETPYEIGRVKG